MTNMTDDEIRDHLRMMKDNEINNEIKQPTFKQNIAHVIDIINNPPHYTSGGIETIDYMEAKSTPEEFRGHLRLTALKYLSRAGLKENTLQDLRKAQWYVNALIEFIEDSNDRA
jgi:hypothetical protein